MERPLFVVLCALSSLSFAQARLEYDAPSTCPNEQVLRETVVRRLGLDPFAGEAPLSIRVAIAPIESGLRATMIATAGTELGQRTLDAGEGACEELVASLALAIAVMLQARARPSPPPQQRIEEHAPDPPRPAPRRVLVSTSAMLGAGLVPGAAVGGTATIGMRLELIVLALEARVLGAAFGRAPVAMLDLDSVLATIAPVVCARERFLVACGALRIGGVWASSRGVPQPRGGAGFFASLSAYAGLSIPLLEELSLDVLGEVEVPFTPTSIDLGASAAWTSSFLAGALRLGVTGAL